MPNHAIATLAIDSDWATIQLVSEGATIQQIPSMHYPPNVIFTQNGVLFGQPNEQLKPQMVEIKINILANDHSVTFITGKGDNGVNGARDGCVTVTLCDIEYTNTCINGDGLNIKAFYDAPLQVRKR